MELKTAIQDRCSTRGFLQKPVERETLRQVLELATRAVSANNLQPWELLVVTGEPLERLRRSNMEDDERGAAPDYEGAYPEEPYRHRAKEIGKALYAAMEIRREDRERRKWWGQRGLRFFDAPAVVLLCMDRSLGSEDFRFDLGCLTQNLCLAAMEYGLGTCVEEQAIYYQRGLREVLGVPESKRFVIGVAMGYPDPDFAANRVKSAREPVDAVTRWFGF